jgi:peroxiredoxin
MHTRRWQSLSARALAACTFGFGVPVSLATPETVPQVGIQAPDFTARDYVSGERVHLAAQKGKVAVLTFWATWCAPCRNELPNLEKLQEYLGKDKITILAVNFRDDDPATVDRVRKDAKEAGWKLHLLLDPGERIAKAYGISAIPRMYIIGRDGRIHSIHAGFGDGSLDDMLTDLHTVLTGEPLEAPAAPAATP